MTLSYNFYFGWEEDGWSDGWMNGWTDRRMDGLKGGKERRTTEVSFLNLSDLWYYIK